MRRNHFSLLAAAALAVAVAGCGSTSGSSSSPGTAPSSSSAGVSSSANNSAPSSSANTSKAKGTAFIAYAGSLQLVNDKFVGPAFQKATSYIYKGQGAGAFAVANLIKSGEIHPDVFEPIGTAPLALLEPKLATWGIGFASSPIVVAYNPKSPFASQLKAIADHKAPMKNLFTLMQKPSFHLGRTDPATDPQGQDFLLMLELAQQHYNLPSGTAKKIYGSIENPKQVFSETGILSRLQAGQLDASSAYLPEAIQRHLPYISLPAAINLGSPTDASAYQKASITLKSGKVVHGAPIEVYISALKGAPDASGADAFIDFVLSSKGKALYKSEGYTLTPLSVTGTRSDIPQSVMKVAFPGS